MHAGVECWQLMKTKKQAEVSTLEADSIMSATIEALAVADTPAAPVAEPKKRRGFGRRKLPDPNAPVDPRSPPPRPPALEIAKVSLQKTLGDDGNVAPGFGLGDESSKTRLTPAWRLYVFYSSQENANAAVLPAEHQGFEVAKRLKPVVSPLWGKYKHP